MRVPSGDIPTMWLFVARNAWPCGRPGREKEKRVTIGGGADGLKLHQATLVSAATRSAVAAMGIARFQSGRGRRVEREPAVAATLPAGIARASWISRRATAMSGTRSLR